MRRDRLHAFRPFHIVLILAFMALFVKVVSRIKSLWIAEALSLGLFVATIEVTCYYYSIFILAALLSKTRRGVEQWVLCVAGVSQLLAVNHYISWYYDYRYWAQALLFCVFSVSLLAAYWPPQKKTAKAPEPTRPTTGSPALEGAGPSSPPSPPST
jgi:hypothetical protein